jgi:hypothetical protein
MAMMKRMMVKISRKNKANVLGLGAMTNSWISSCIDTHAYTHMYTERDRHTGTHKHTCA